jgi:hypothetical protein
MRQVKIQGKKTPGGAERNFKRDGKRRPGMLHRQPVRRVSWAGLEA